MANRKAQKSAYKRRLFSSCFEYPSVVKENKNRNLGYYKHTFSSLGVELLSFFLCKIQSSVSPSQKYCVLQMECKKERVKVAKHTEIKRKQREKWNRIQTYLIPFDKLFAILKRFGYFNRSKWYVCASRHRIGSCVAWALLWIWCGGWRRWWWCLIWCLMLRWLLLGFACKCWCCHFYAFSTLFSLGLSLYFLSMILVYQISPLLHCLIISRISEWLVEYFQTTLPHNG